MVGSSRRVPSRVITGAYRELLSRPPTRHERSQDRRRLRQGETLGDVVLDLARSEEHRDRQVIHALLPALSDTEFLHHAYWTVLNREADADGFEHFRGLLADGMPRETVVRLLVESDEHVHRAAAAAYPMPDLIAAQPDRYQYVRAMDGTLIPCLVATSSGDFDWIADRIADADYYDRPGIWGADVTEDKRIMAAVLAGLADDAILDLGCANGTVLACLADLGIRAEGVEISASAAAHADPRIRARIHIGSIEDLPSERRYRLVSGLDIFEHVTPLALGSTIDSIRGVLEPAGLVFANIPAFGTDPVFGTVFEPYLDPWVASAARGDHFELLHVDDTGFPLHGHLIWADWRWWESAFTARGFARRPDLEAPIHASHDEFWSHAAPARRSFFVFERVEHG
jgi:SAM-dependent methyltransferase